LSGFFSKSVPDKYDALRPNGELHRISNSTIREVFNDSFAAVVVQPTGWGYQGTNYQTGYMGY
jgi:hypothetical protein